MKRCKISYSVVHCIAVQRSVVHCIAVRYGVVHCGTVRYGVVHRGTVRYGVVRYDVIDTEIEGERAREREGAREVCRDL